MPARCWPGPMTHSRPPLSQSLIAGANAAAQKITKNLTRPFRRLAKAVSRPLKNHRAVKVFKAYDAALVGRHGPTGCPK